MKKSARNHKKKTVNLKRAVSWWVVPILTALFVVTLGVSAYFSKKDSVPTSQPPAQEDGVVFINPDNIDLPKPDLKSNLSVEAAMQARRSRREFTDQSLTLKQVSQMLWAAQGVTTDWGGRTVPSARSTYPLTVFLIANKVDGLDPGQYQYIPGERLAEHALLPIKKIDLQKPIYELLNQNSFKNAPAVIMITGSMGKMAEAMGGTPSDHSVYLEAGHAGQNISLQAESLKLGTVMINAFNEARIRQLVTLPPNDTLIYLIPFGTPKL